MRRSMVRFGPVGSACLAVAGSVALFGGTTANAAPTTHFALEPRFTG